MKFIKNKDKYLFLILFFPFFVNADITTGLINHWKFNESSGTVGVDSVGSSNATLLNNPSWVVGKVDGALSFDGVSQYATVSNYSLPADFTLAFWINNPNGHLMYQGAGTGSRWFVSTPNQGKLSFYTDGIGWKYSNTNLASGWNHVALSVSNNILTIYLNGNLANSPTTISNVSNNNTNILIGKSPNSTFSGSIDDFRIYNRVLSSSDVSELYSSTGGITPSSPPSPAPAPSPSPTPTPNPAPTPVPPSPPPVPISSDIVPSDRLPLPGTWESAGVEGGIPARSTICADVTQSPYNVDKTGVVSAVAGIQSAINNCPDGQVVFVPAGDYLIDARLRIQKSITLRGAGSSTHFKMNNSLSNILIGGLGPWPPPKANSIYNMPVTGGATRGSNTVNVADTSNIPVGKMIMIDEVDDPSLVWTKPGVVGRFRGSMHMVESKTSTSVTFRPALQIDYINSPQLSRYPDLTQNAGIEDINFLGTGTTPSAFINITSAWNVWVKGSEFSNMPSKTITVGWVGHLEIRKNYMHDQSNGGPNSEGIDLANDTNWSLVVDNICVAAGNPQINIGDMGPNPYYSGGVGNVIAYNYCVDAYYTDPPTSTNHGMMANDIGTNHSPHNQYNLVEGNYIGKFVSDSYHGSGSHALLLRNVITGKNRWTYADNRVAVQIDRWNLFYSLVGNVLGIVGVTPTYEYMNVSGYQDYTKSIIYRLGYPDVGNMGFIGTYPPIALNHSDGGAKDLYVDRNNSSYGTTIIEGNWNQASGQNWTGSPKTIPNSYFLSSKPGWFGSLAWPPVSPSNPVTNDPTIIPAGYRYVYGVDPGGIISPTPTPTPPPPSPTPTPVSTPIPGDLNSDHIVNSLDFSIMNSNWYTSDATADLNSDRSVNSLDYAILSSNWGKTW